jgi:hypothetical protein
MNIIQFLRIFHILFLLSYFCCCYCYTCYKIINITVTVAATITIKLLLLLLPLLLLLCYYYHTTVLLITLLQIFSSPGVVELTTQLLILANILWLPLCRINKFGLNTLPSKTVAIPYTCGLSRCCSLGFAWFSFWFDKPWFSLREILISTVLLNPFLFGEKPNAAH